MSHLHVRSLILGLACAVMLIPAAGASARTNVAVGLGDQGAAMFSSPAYQALHLKKTRYFIRWNSIHNPGELALADQFVAAARKAHVRVLMHISSDNLAVRKGKLPSLTTYKKDVGALVRRYKKMGVKDWGVWNEANHASQPTYRNPRRAAQFFLAMRSMCHGCTIVALDVLDQAGATTYIKHWFAAIPASKRRYVRVVGIHNYSDVNRRRSSGTRKIIAAVKHAAHRSPDFWFTETGGVVEFGGSFPCSEKRAASRTAYMFSLAKKFRHDVTRLYVYNWQGADCGNRFDAGLVRLDGSTRPAYDVFRKDLRSFAR